MLQHRQLPWQDKQSKHHRCRYAGFQSGIISIKSHPSLSKGSYYKIRMVAGPARHRVCRGADECSWGRGQKDQKLWETNNVYISNTGQRDRELCNCLQIQGPVYQPLCKDTQSDHQNVW